eukprot:3579146-Rhodomonas_salina.1
MGDTKAYRQKIHFDEWETKMLQLKVKTYSTSCRTTDARCPMSTRSALTRGGSKTLQSNAQSQGLRLNPTPCRLNPVLSAARPTLPRTLFSLLPYTDTNTECGSCVSNGA